MSVPASSHHGEFRLDFRKTLMLTAFSVPQLMASSDAIGFRSEGQAESARKIGGVKDVRNLLHTGTNGSTGYVYGPNAGCAGGGIALLAAALRLL
jgi:hypothetical protein